MFASKSNLLVQCDDVLLPGVGPGQPQCEIIRLRSRIDEIAHGQVAGHLVGEPLGTAHQLVVQESIVCRQIGHLLGARLHHFRMTMTD